VIMRTERLIEAADLIVWLKTSIAGIVVLGALGSLLAYAFLRITRWAINKFGRPLLARFALRLFKTQIINFVLIRDLKSGGDKAYLVLYVMQIYRDMIVNAVMFSIFLSASLLYFSILGAHLSFAALLLVGLAILTAVDLLRSVFLTSLIDERLVGAKSGEVKSKIMKMDRAALMAYLDELTTEMDVSKKVLTDSVRAADDRK
jgi:hypothetical protein